MIHVPFPRAAGDCIDGLVAIARQHYLGLMSLLLRRIARTAARRIVLDRRAKNLAANTARGLADEVRTIAGDKDPARAAGRSFRLALEKLRSGRDEPDDQSRR